jgi:hypothetical protein
LVIGQINLTDADSVESYPIHATCRSKLQGRKTPYDDIEICCDYCGIELNPRYISLDLHEGKELTEYQKAKNQTTIKNYESAVETLFDDPYIFHTTLLFALCKKRWKEVPPILCKASGKNPLRK